MNTPYVDEAAVEALARSVGIDIEPERRAIVAERLNEMHAIAKEIHSIDFRDCPPAPMFVPSWPIVLTEEDLKWASSLI